MTNKETALVAAINAAWSQYELDVASVYAVQETATTTRDSAIADAIDKYGTPIKVKPSTEAPILEAAATESTTEAAPLEDKT